MLVEFSTVMGNAPTVARQILEKLSKTKQDESRLCFSQDRYIFHILRSDGLIFLRMANDTFERKTRKPRKRLIKKSSSTPGKDSSFSDFGIEDDEGGIHRGYGVEEDVEEIMRDDYSDSGGKMKMEKGKKRIGEEKKRKGEKKFRPRKSGWTSRDYEVDPEVKENLGNHCGR